MESSIHDDFEILKLTDALTYFGEMLGGNNPLVQRVLAGKSPRAKVDQRIEVPASIYDWKKSADPRAKEVQSTNRAAFQKAFAK